jgi:hypothetical protein
MTHIQRAVIKRVEMVCNKLGVRIISECELIKDPIFDEPYYSFGIHFIDLYNTGLDTIMDMLEKELGCKTGYDAKHNKVCIKNILISTLKVGDLCK